MKHIKSLVWSDHFFKEKKKSLANALKKLDLFSDLHKKELREVSKIAYLRQYKDGEIIFKKNDPSYGLFIVLKGEAQIFLQDKKNKQTLGNYHPLEYFGEFSLVKDNTRKASAVSIGESTLCYIFNEDLKKLFVHHPKLGLSVYEKIFEILIEKLEYADEYMMKQNGKNTKQ